MAILDIILTVINTVGVIFKPVINLFRIFKINITNVECIMSTPAIPDGEGGYINGSHAEFRLEIINKKDKKFVLSDIHCKAMQQSTVLKDRICCYDKNNSKKVACRTMYEPISAINVQPQSSVSYYIILTLSGDLSNCNQLIFFYKSGRRNKEAIVWDNQCQKNIM